MGVEVTLREVTPVTLVTRKRPSWPPLDLVKYPATPPLAGRSGQPGSRRLHLIVEDLEQTDFVRINRLEKMILSMEQPRGVMVVVTTRAGSDIINRRVLEMSADRLANREDIQQDHLVTILPSYRL